MHQHFGRKSFIPVLTHRALSSSPFSSLPAAISCHKPKMRDTDRLLIGKLIAIVSSSRNTRQLFS